MIWREQKSATCFLGALVCRSKQPMTMVDTADLSIAVEEFGASADPAVLLLHGWPDDASTWAAIAPVIAAAGKRVVVPMLRGFGDTRFRRPEAPRAGDSAIHAMDMIALMDPLGIERFAVAGHDWGATPSAPARRSRRARASGSR